MNIRIFITSLILSICLFGCAAPKDEKDIPKDSSVTTTSETAKKKNEPATPTPDATVTPKPTLTSTPEPTPATDSFEGPDISEPGINDDRTLGEKSAQNKAESYLSSMPFSREGLIEQLLFEGFSEEEAVFGADNCNADWYEQAVEKAEDYLISSSFSYNGLIDQLIFSGFTEDEAVYGAENCGAVWQEEAIEKAASYMANDDFSREGLLSQLEYDGFTEEEAENAVIAIGF